MPSILEVERLKKYFPIKSGVFSRIQDYVKAVDDVSFSIKKGKALGIVGESGCGKSTLARTILRLVEPTEGIVRFKGENLFHVQGEKLRRMRNKMQIIFQDPYSSLDPRMITREILVEPLETHTEMSKKELRERALELLQTVGMNEDHLRRYPHEFSGGQQQRINIARALSLNPDLLVLDEPTSALDVSVQAQILNLLKSLQREYTLTYLFISHDLSVIRHICDHIAIMYVGKIVENTDERSFFESPKHPYTEALLDAIPKSRPDIEKKQKLLKGEPPDAVHPPPGCRFHPRCPHVMAICKKEEPQLVEVEKDHYVACHLYDGS
jgi:oligopeptide/dipeptide ABC transporter ATP-binding protein